MAIKYQKLIFSGTQESGERFCAPLDYIFVSPEWKVEDAIKLQSKDEALKMPCPFPNQVSKQKQLYQQQQTLRADLKMNREFMKRNNDTFLVEYLIQDEPSDHVLLWADLSLP